MRRSLVGASLVVAVLAAAPFARAQQQAADVDATWARALDEVVAGDLEAALADCERLEGDEAAPAERRAAAHDLAERIRKRLAARPLSAPEAAPSGAGAPAPSGVVAPSGAPAEEGADRSGRAFLVGVSTALGLGLWGWSLPTALDIQNDRGYVGLYMVTAGAAFGGPFLLTRTHRATWGMGNMMWLGGTRGALGGVATAVLIGGTPSDGRAPAAGVFIGSTLGTAAGALWADRTDMAPGTAHVTGNGADVGVLAGLATNYLAHENGSSDRAMAASALAGGLVGGVGGHLLARARGHAFTWGDAEVMRLPTALGLDAAATLAQWDGQDADRPFVAHLLVGGALGAAAGEWLVRERDYAVGQALILDLGTVAGALGAMGSFYLITGESSAKAFITSSLAGGTAVFTALYLTLDAPLARKAAAWIEPRGATVRGLALLPWLDPRGGHGLALGGAL